ncbi:hypothetical protein Psfp_02018 [Pelotomaculum sp. FP]|nr:hypothetical protein Psfp_02018 [Pelotomaculum sp. FP]
MEEVSCSMVLADSAAPCDRDWLESETCQAPVFTCSIAMVTCPMVSFIASRVLFRASLMIA